MSKRAIVIALAALLCAATVHASGFSVLLKSGQTFETRYPPVDAEWSADVSMILTDQGNWIALDKADISEVTSEVESAGIGERIGPATVIVGWGYNDGAGDGEGEGEGGADGAGGAGGLPAFLTGGDNGAGGAASGAASSYTIEQFVDTGQAGASGGIPVDSVVYQ